MKKWISLVVVAVLLFGTVGMVACGGGDEEEEQASGTPSEQMTQQPQESGEDGGEVEESEAPQETVEPAPETSQSEEAPAVSGEIKDLLEKGAAIECASYKQSISGPGVPNAETTVWMKKKMIRTETTMMGIKSVSIMNMETGKMYVTSGGMTMEMDIPAEASEPSEQVEEMAQYNPQVVGTETIDGMKCKVVQAVTEDGKMTMWLWEKNGFPVKVATEMPDGTMLIEYKDISFDCAPDSMFEPPENAQPMPSMPNVPNMPNMPDMPNMPIPQQ